MRGGKEEEEEEECFHLVSVHCVYVLCVCVLSVRALSVCVLYVYVVCVCTCCVYELSLNVLCALQYLPASLPAEYNCPDSPISRRMLVLKNGKKMENEKRKKIDKKN